MAKNKTKIQGKQAFDSYYEEIFSSRWPKLKSALLEETCPVGFCPFEKETYFLDKASLYAASCLPLGENALRILDMCAAPGGKTLVLAKRMAQDAHLYSNERSPERKSRLVKVCTEHLDEDTLSRVHCSCSDAATWCTKANLEPFDAILLDAPCSSERHVLCDSKYLSVWTPSRVKTLSMAQWALLSCAYRLLNNGGHILYSTCALNPTENDGVVSKLLKKFPESCVIKDCSPCQDLFGFEKDFESLSPEKTEYGFHILPDSSNGAGPLYFSLIQKIESDF